MIKKTLNQLYQEHQGKVSDKWSIYLSEYERIFAEYRDSPVRMLEIGIQNGGSLEIWSKYFENAQQLIGCDINSDCEKLVYENPRIKVVIGDANKDETKKRIFGYCNDFNIVIDDGSHKSSDIVRSFVKYFPHVKNGGIFVVEDLHCSYWKEFEGGLFDPFSSITFFKRLADIASFEHWGTDRQRKELLAGFSKQYDVVFDEDILSHIHAVEFINSICVIRKSSYDKNILGARIIAGQQALIEEKVIVSTASIAQYCTPDQKNNFFSNLLTPPDEDFVRLFKELAELKVLLLDRDQVIRGLLMSRSWKITAPLRWVSDRLKHIYSSVRILFNQN